MWIIIGLVAGLLIGIIDGFDGLLTGLLLGAVVGGLLQRLANRVEVSETKLERIQSRVEYLEHELNRVAAKKKEVVPEPAPDTVSSRQPEDVRQPDPWLDKAISEESDDALDAKPVEVASTGWAEPDTDAEIKEPTLLAGYIENARSWLFGGNTVVRVGLVVLFFGLAFLARFAVEHSLIPVELRLAAIAIGGIALLVVGWRLRHKRSGYALSLQGGGVAVLYLTIFAAMRMYQMIPPTLGFGMLLAIVIFSVLLAVLQNSQALAVIGTAGGFAAPILASTGQGNHVLLFSYYLLLNIGVLTIAWKRAWKILNLVGFLFTFSISLLWGARSYRPELFVSTEPFLIAFVLMYIAIAILFAWRSAPELKHYVDGTIVFGTPVVGFGLQAALVQDMPYGLAWSALGLGGFYVLLARWLHGRSQPTLGLLVESFLALGVAFLTLTIPLAVDGKWTAAAWALEGAALLWVGLRQSRKLAMASGLILQLLAGAFFISDGGLDGYVRAWPILNSYLLGSVMIALAGFVSSLMAYRSGNRWSEILSVAAPALLIWSVIWWLAGGMQELDVWLNNRQMVSAALIFFAVSGALAAWISQRLNWSELGWSGLLSLPGMAISLFLTATVAGNPLSGWGGVAWILATASAAFGFFRLEQAAAEKKLLGQGHTLLLWLVSLALVWSVGDILDEIIVGDAWMQSGVLGVFAMVLIGIVAMVQRDAWPFGAWQHSYLLIGGAGVGVVMFLWAISITFTSGGDVAPLPYLPILNPLDLTMLIAMFAAFRWWQANGSDKAGGWLNALKSLAVVAFILINGVLLRAVHHFTGVPWREKALFASDEVQASLSLFWAVLGLALAFAATRKQMRTLWLVGAGLLGVVVVKLFLVDMANTGTVARIVSFIGAGLLLLAVGYFSPLPPVKEKGA